MTVEWLAQLARVAADRSAFRLRRVRTEQRGEGSTHDAAGPGEHAPGCHQHPSDIRSPNGGRSASETKTLLNTGIKPKGGTIESNMQFGGNGDRPQHRRV